jgi:hypothetical protein
VNQLVDETTERRRVHPALFHTAGQIVEQGMDREGLGVRRPVALEQGRYGLRDSEQTKGQVDQGIQLLDLGFERGDAIFLGIGHALSEAVGFTRPRGRGRRHSARRSIAPVSPVPGRRADAGFGLLLPMHDPHLPHSLGSRGLQEVLDGACDIDRQVGNPLQRRVHFQGADGWRILTL